MFRDRSFLEQVFKKIPGFTKPSTRDRWYIVGVLYDEIMESRFIDIDRINEVIKYTGEHYEELFKRKNNSGIPTTKNIIKYFVELLENDFKNEEILEQYPDLYKRHLTFKRVRDIIKEQKKGIEKFKHVGLYGIYIDNELVYIGKTMRSFEERFNEHKEKVNAPYKDNDIKLYKTLKEAKKQGKEIQMKELISLYNLLIEVEGKKNNNFTNEELCDMELALIKVLQPRCNVEGKDIPYVYR